MGKDLLMEAEIAVHAAPVYFPAMNKLYFSQLTGNTSPLSFSPQLVINLNVEAPYLGDTTAWKRFPSRSIMPMSEVSLHIGALRDLRIMT